MVSTALRHIGTGAFKLGRVRSFQGHAPVWLIRLGEGAILLFDRESGAPVCVVDAGEVTAIRTACASAAATDALARQDATCLAILGTGEQAWQHALAVNHVRPLQRIVIWGRSQAKANVLAARIETALARPVEVAQSAAAAWRAKQQVAASEDRASRKFDMSRSRSACEGL